MVLSWRCLSKVLGQWRHCGVQPSLLMNLVWRCMRVWILRVVAHVAHATVLAVHERKNIAMRILTQAWIIMTLT